MSLRAFFAEELAPSRRRIVEAARNAVKATLTTGLAAIMQVVGPFGPLFAFRIGQPGVSFGLFEGAVAIICAAAMQAAIVPITGKLLDYPGLILIFLFTVFATIAYLLSTKLFMPLALVTVGTITTVYVGIFEPGEIGWGATYTFDGILVATLVMVVIDTYFWPSPPEPKLLEFIAEELASTQKHLAMVGRRYLDPFAAPLPESGPKSRLASSLALLRAVEEHMKPPPQRLMALVNGVVTTEHIYLEVERLAVLADEPISDALRQTHREEIENSLEILDSAFTERIELVLTGLPDVRQTAPWASDLRLTIQRLSNLNAQTAAATNRSFTIETLNFLGFVGGLEAIASLLEPQERPPEIAAAQVREADGDSESPRIINPTKLRFSVKLGTAMTLGLLVGLTTQRADLQTILWSIAVVGQPNQYGAVIRKTALRVAGCVLGGLAALATMIIVSQHFDTLPPYLVAIFVVTMGSSYVSQSSEWLGYAGIQTGITFLICYVGLGPSSDIYKPLWRFWGILLGVLTAGFVFLFLWPEYASDKVIENLRKLMRTTFAFAKAVEERTVAPGRVAEFEPRVSTELLDVLNMTDQARLEGRRGSAISAAAVEAAALLARIAYRFQTIARARLSGSELNIPQHLRERLTTLEREYCTILESGLRRLESARFPEESVPAASTESPIERTALDESIAVLCEGTDLSIHAGLTPRLEAYRRLPVLLSRLDLAIQAFVLAQ